jgi:hypothetical protein
MMIVVLGDMSYFLAIIWCLGALGNNRRSLGLARKAEYKAAVDVTTELI